MFVVIYRWRIRPEWEARFRSAWRRRTEKIRILQNSLGSRLHRQDDGTLLAIALWPTRIAWRDAGDIPDDVDDAKTFDSAVEERLPTLTMTVLDDLWSP
jgi:hypothetical protein